MNRHRKWAMVMIVTMAVALPLLAGAFATAAFGAEQAAEATETASSPAKAPVSGLAIAFGLAILSGAIGAGYAVAKVGSAAIGAVTERPEMMGRALVFVALAEGIAVWGMLGAILLVTLLR